MAAIAEALRHTTRMRGEWAEPASTGQEGAWDAGKRPGLRSAMDGKRDARV